MKLYNEHGTILAKRADCHRCGEDEIGSHFDAAWCHACGWRGTLADLLTASLSSSREAGQQ